MKRGIVLALAVGSVMALAFASVAEATHPRPGGGSPFRVPFVPAYQQCITAGTQPNSKHVPPLALDSCSPPVLQSDMLTTGNLGAMAGSTRLDVFCNPSLGGGSPPCGPTGDQLDIKVVASLSDVRCSTTTPMGCEGGAGSDFTGRLIGRSLIRITDHANRPQPGPGLECPTGNEGSAPCVTATVVDLTFAVPVPCTATGGANGSNCTITTTIDSQVPTTVKERQRAVISIFNLNAGDPGNVDGDLGPACPPFCGTGDENTYVDQGIFIP